VATPAPYEQPQAFDADGKPVPFSAEAHFEKGARLYAKDPYGKLVTVPVEEAGTKGYQVLSPEQLAHAYNEKQYGTGVGNIAKTGLTSAASGATLGLSDKALIAIGGEQARRELQGRREAMPNLHRAAEIAGMVAPVLLTDGAAAGVEGAEGVSALGRLGQLATAPSRAVGLAGRLAERGAEVLGAEGAGMLATGVRLGARGAAEGALYGAGHEVSQTAIDDTPLTAERLLAGAWDGAKMGGAFGSGAGVLGAGIGKVGRKLLGKITEGLPPPVEAAEGAAVPAAVESPAPVKAAPLEPPATVAPAEPTPLAAAHPDAATPAEPAGDFRFGGPETFEPAPKPAPTPGTFQYGEPPTATETPAASVVAPEPTAAAPKTPTLSTRIGEYLNDAGPNMLMGILTGHPLTGVVAGAGVKFAKQLIQERGADVMATLADRLSTVSGRIDLAAKVAAMAEKPRALVAPAAVNVPKMFTHYSSLASEAQTEPLKFAQRIGESTADVATRIPDVASKMQQTILADMAYLNSIHPAPPSRSSSTLTPQAVQAPVYSFDQKKAFVDAAMALDNPLGVFNDIARGDLPLDAITAIKVRRPGLYSEMRESVIKHTISRKEELPFKRRMLLGVAFDYPADWSMLNVSTIQTSLASAAKSPNNPHGAPTKVNDQPGEQIAPGAF